MSYLERTLYWFLKNRIFGGIKKLTKKEYLPFALIILIIMTANTILALLYHFKFLISLEFIRFMLILELFLSFGIISSGILIGRIKKLWIYYLFSFIVITLFIFAFFYFEWDYNHLFFQFAKLTYLLCWILILSISMFFLILYFFTSFPKKVMTLGMPKDHIFFGVIVKIIIYISIVFYIYIIFQMDLISVIFGIFGIINALIVLILIWRAPKKVDTNPGIVNFATAIGFFNTFMIYHLYMSITLTSESVVSLIFEIFMLLIGVLYIVQILTMRVSESPERIKPSEVKFQSRVYFTDKIKKVFGEKGVVLLVLGLAVGYHMVYLDSFFITDLPILTKIAPNLKISDLYHRIFLITSFMITLIACLAFKMSKRFKEFMVDKFTLTQVIKYIGSLFKRPENGPSPFELGIQAMGKKLGEGVKKLGDKWQESIRKIVNGKDEIEDE